MVLVRQFPVPVEGIKLQSSAIEAFVDNAEHGKGTLFITEANIAWINSDTGEGFKIAYKKMTLHAISRDPVVHTRACLYIMVNGNILDEDENFVVECPVERDLDEGDEEMTEIRFVPDDSSALDDMYKAIQECSLLHPDPASDMSNEEEEEEAIEEGVEDEEGGNAVALMEEEDDDDEVVEAERLEQFIRMQLHFGNSRNGNGSDGDEDTAEDVDPSNPLGLSFIPQPGQFDEPGDDDD